MTTTICGKRDHRPRAIRRERSRHAPDGLRHYGDGHELETCRKSFGDRPCKSRRAKRKGEQDQGGRHGETEPRREAAPRPLPRRIPSENPT